MKSPSHFATVIATVRSFVSNWTQDGEQKCIEFLKPHLSDAAKYDTNSPNTLTASFHCLIQSLLELFVETPMATSQLVTFFQRLLETLPSSSDPAPSSKPRPEVVIGELIVDVYWSVEMQVEEHLVATKAVLSAELEKTDRHIDVAIKSPLPGQHFSDDPGFSVPYVERRRRAESGKEILYDFLGQLLRKHIVEARVCRERLDTSTLAAVNLIGDGQVMTKKEIRMRTGLFYKQNKFNLLREQSEGYTKLSTELIQSIGAPHSSTTALPTESSDIIEARACAAWEKVVGLIGYFDLDPSRALDIILDVLTTHITTHYSFFLALLRASTWHRTQVPDVHASRMEVDDAKRGHYKNKTLDEVLTISEGESFSKPRNASKAQVCAEVLGFKFAHYQAQDVPESTPKALYVTAALLIREGIITLEDLYPHLSPTDENMESVYHQAYKDSISDRVAAAKVSALAVAAPLTDDSAANNTSRSRPTGADAKKPSPDKKEVPNQKLDILAALLSLGAVRPSIAILTRFPWIPAAYSHVADLFLRVLRVSLQPLYDTTYHSNSALVRSNTTPRLRYGANGLVHPPLRKQVLTLLAPLPPNTAGSEFVFFYPPWDVAIPRCTEHSDIENVLVPLLQFLGVQVARDFAFVTKLCRIGRVQLTAATVLDDVKSLWVRITREFLLPTISLQRSNAVCSVEVWMGVVRHLDVQTRWSLYGEWKQSLYKKHPEMRVTFVEADREAKGVLRRLSTKNVSQMSRNIAKLCYSNPCIVFTNIIKQVESYENMAATIIDAFRYVINMGFDVLSYILMDAFTDPSKQRVKDDGTNASLWLQSLAAFTGAVHRKYTLMDPEHVLKYVAHQLRNNQSNELIVLQELIYRMTGIKPLATATDSQILAMGGGPTLRIEAVASEERGALEERPQVSIKSRERIISSLQSSDLILPLLILIAQHRQTCVFSAPEDHLKSIASSYDAVQGNLFQYIEVLSSLLAPEAYASLLPSVYDLCCVYEIDLPAAMEIHRPSLHASIFAHALSMQEKNDVNKLADATEAEKRLKAKILQQKKTQDQSPALANSDLPREVSPAAVVVSNAGTPMENETPWLPMLEPLITDVGKVLPSNVVQGLGPTFYVTFWQMSLYDINPPFSRYDQENTRLRTLSKEANDNILALKDVSANKARRERLNSTIDSLSREMRDHIIAREFTIKRLQREKSHWFTIADRADLATQIIQYCIHPRSLISPMDADYCVQMIRTLHAIGTPGFSTLMCYDKLLGDHVSTVVFSCTANEARSYGRFVLGILRDLSAWHKDEKQYLQDNRDKRGTILPGFQRGKIEKKLLSPEDLYDWEKFKQLHNKWHKKLAVNLSACLASAEYMHIHNAIVVLQEILPVFPVAAVNSASGKAISEAMAKCIELEHREDLKILAGAYHARFQKVKAVWEAPQAPVVSISKTPPGRVNHTPGTTSLSGNDKPQTAGSTPAKRSAQPPTTTPSRTGNESGISDARTDGTRPLGGEIANGEKAAAMKLALESIPRPEVVKRIRPDNRSGTSTPKAEDIIKADGKSVVPSDPNNQTASLDTKVLSSKPARADMSPLRPSAPSSHGAVSKVESDSEKSEVVGAAKEVRPRSPPSTNAQQLLASKKEPPHSPRNQRSTDEPHSRPIPTQDMPPPAAPSSTPSAQELRSTAKQALSQRGDERSENKSSRSVDIRPLSRPPSRPPSRGSTRGPSPPASRRRSPTPPSRGPPFETHPQREVDRSDRSTSRTFPPRQDRIQRGGIDIDRMDQNARDRVPVSHNRDLERIRDPDRDRDRERDRERDRHRRDWDKDKSRDVSVSRKDREVTVGREPPSHPRRDTLPDDLPTGPDLSRTRSFSTGNGEDHLGKRRRALDDEADRGSKRSTRHKDPAYRDDRGSRHKSERERERPRDSERRRRDREGDSGSQGDGRSITEGQERPSETSRSTETSVGSKHTPAPPSAPRAMADPPIRPPRTDFNPMRDSRGRGWSGRDNVPSSSSHPSVGPANRVEGSGHPNGARNRDDQLTRSSHFGGIGPRNDPVPFNGERSGTFSRDEARVHENPRKRTFSDRGREKDEGEGPGEAHQPPKRLRINRTSRYALDDAMQKSLDSNSKGDKGLGRTGRKD